MRGRKRERGRKCTPNEHLTLRSIWYSKKPSESDVAAIRTRWSKRNTCLGSFFTLQLAGTAHNGGSEDPFVKEEWLHEKVSISCREITETRERKGSREMSGHRTRGGYI